MGSWTSLGLSCLDPRGRGADPGPGAQGQAGEEVFSVLRKPVGSSWLPHRALGSLGVGPAWGPPGFS